MLWKTLKVPEIEALPAPVFVRAQDILPGYRFPAHAHPWHQLIYAISGSLVVEAASQRVVCGPEQAVWIPTGIAHEVASRYGAQFRSLYLRASPRLRMPPRYALLQVSPLLRELIREAAWLGEQDAAGAGALAYTQRVHRLILDQLPRLEHVQASLPWPQTAMLRKLCEAIDHAPADAEDIAAWGARLGASERTLTRRFQAELGMNFREWKRRLRLFKSMELLGAGMSVTATALELGYGSPSAFSFMFTREMGYSPKAHRAAPGRVRQRSTRSRAP